MAVRLKVDVRTQLARARLRKFGKAVEKAGQQTVQDLVNIGKDKARELVPKGSTGWLYKQISGRVIPGPNPKAQIFLKEQIVPDSHRLFPNTGQYPQFNLAKWMHETGGKFKTPNPLGTVGKQHIKSGDPQFMYTTARYLNGRKKTIASGNFNQIKAKTR